MPKKYFQSGFVPPIVIILLAIIGISGILIFKNISTDKSQPTNQAFNITNTKTTPTPTVSQTKSKSQTPTPIQKITPTPTTSPNTNNNSNNPTSTPVPTSTPTSASSPTPTVINYGTVKGTVRLIQPNGGAPLPLAGVSVNLTCDNCNKLYNGNVQATITDDNGNFIFNNVPPSVDIQLIALAYARSTTPININLTPGQTLIQDISTTLPTY